jgi:hypothetical protein
MITDLTRPLYDLKDEVKIEGKSGYFQIVGIEEVSGSYEYLLRQVKEYVIMEFDIKKHKSKR